MPLDATLNSYFSTSYNQKYKNDGCMNMCGENDTSVI